MSNIIRISAETNRFATGIRQFRSYNWMLGNYVRINFAQYAETREQLLSRPRGREIMERWAWAELAIILRVRGIGSGHHIQQLTRFAVFV